MLSCILLVFASAAISVRAQSIYTPYAFTNFAGQPGGPGAADGVGRAARFRSPSATAVDGGGNVYVADQFNFTIRKITPAGVVSTIAGTPLQSGTNDGQGALARFGSTFGGPVGIAVDAATNVYVADTLNNTIRKLTLAGTNWNVTTFAGRARQSGTNDGTGSAARFNSPSGMTTDSAGNLYLIDGFAVRRVTPAGVVTTLAGSIAQAGIADGTNSAARFGSTFLGAPKGVAADSAGNLYVADTFNSTIRRVSPVGADWVVTTFAGSPGLYGFSDGTNNAAQFANPHGIAVDGAGSIYVTDPPVQTIRKIVLSGPNRVVTTFAGAATQFGRADGIGGAARFQTPQGASVDSAGNIYVAELGNNAIRKVTPNAEVTTLAGQGGGPGSADGIGDAAQFNIPHGAAVDSAGNVYVGDTFNHTVRKITPAGFVTTIAGSPGNKGFVDGVGTAEAPQFNSPIGLSADSTGNIYVADNGNHTIRKATSAGLVTTLAGQVGVRGSANGTSNGASFNSPSGTAVDSAGNVFVADLVNRTIRRITPGGVVSTFAGSTSLQGTNDGVSSAARFTAPMSLAIDSSDNLYVADQGGNTIRKITPGAVVTTLAGLGRVSGTNNGVGSAARFVGPEGVAVDRAGNVYVADTGNDSIRKITPAGVVTTLAGVSGVSGTADGTNGVARFDTPRGIAVDSATNIYVADSVNSTIRKLTIVGTNCVVTTLAGTARQNGSVDGTNSAARFHFPYGLTVDSVGNLYAVDRNNNDIRKITPSGTVTTFAGVPGLSGSVDGQGGAAQLYAPEALVVDGAGNIYVSDYFNNAVRKIAPVGSNWVITTIAGCPTCPPGTNDGPGNIARFNSAFGLTLDNNGNLYLADTGNRTIRKIAPAQPQWIVSTFAGSPLLGGSVDGTGASARFAAPLGLAADANGIYVADSSTIRKITFNGVVATLAGCGTCVDAVGSADGSGPMARFWGARDVAVDSAGNLYVADSANHTVRKLVLNGSTWMVTTVAGSPGQASGADGVGSEARFNQPTGVAVDGAGNVYVVDSGENRVSKGRFVSPSPSFQFGSSADSLAIFDGAFRMRLTSSSSSNAVVVIEASVNLQTWLPVQTNALSAGALLISVPVGTNQHQFFRARPGP